MFRRKATPEFVCGMSTQNNIYWCRNSICGVSVSCPNSLCVILPPIGVMLSHAASSAVRKYCLLYNDCMIFKSAPPFLLSGPFPLLSPPRTPSPALQCHHRHIHKGLGPDTVLTAWEVMGEFFFHSIFTTVIFK